MLANVPELWTITRRLPSRNVYTLTSHRSFKPSSRVRIGRLAGPLSTIYELSTTSNSSTDVAREMIAYGTSTAAASATAAAMMWFAGSVGTASTGTAIATLSGAAYTSAATAWWGGGTVASGGFGMSVGGAVLTGGTALVALGVGYGVYKTWNYFDPTEKDGIDLYVCSLMKRSNLTDASNAYGASLLTDRIRLDQDNSR